MLPVALFGLVWLWFPWQHTAHLTAAACRAEVCTGYVEQLSQLMLSIDTLHIPFTTQYIVGRMQRIGNALKSKL